MPAEVRTCANCIYHVSVDDEAQCHLHPPTNLSKYQQAGYTSEWTKLESLTGWCGQWMADFIVQAKPGPVY